MIPVPDWAAPPRPCAAHPGMNATPTPEPLRVLIVDDCVDTCESLSTLLTAWGHDSRVAHDGPTALAIAPDYRPHVALLDIGMPRMSGWELARRLRQLPADVPLLLIAVSGYGRDEDRRLSLTSGCHFHLVKPLDPTVLETLLTHKRRELSPGTPDV